jgi:hypothetical protein
MQEQQNIDLLKRPYEAFGEGDIDTIIGFSGQSVGLAIDAPSVIPYPANIRLPIR